MIKRLVMLLVTILVSAFIISGCSKDKDEPVDAQENNTEENDEVENEPEEEPEELEDEPENEPEEEPEEDNDTNSDSDFSELIAYMEEETDGTALILYENMEPQVHEMEDISVSLDGYTLLELKDFHTNFQIPFNDQTDGGVILAKYTVTNDSDEDAYYMPSMYMSYTGAPKDFNNYRDLLPLEEQLPTKLSPSEDYLIEAGASITGYYTYPFGEDYLEEILDVSTTVVEVPTAQSEKDSYDTPIGKKGKFTFSLTEDGEEKVSANAAFYNDKVTNEDMGDKKMLKEKDGIGDSEELRDVTVTLDGYQFTEFTPNEVEAPRFSGLDNGIVLLTVKFDIDNQDDADVSKNSISSKLTMNDGTQYTLLERMLLDYRNDDLVKSGETGELLQIYLLDQEQYEKIWKDKSFEIEIGPMKDDDLNDLSKGKKADFTLPK